MTRLLTFVLMIFCTLSVSVEAHNSKAAHWHKEEMDKFIETLDTDFSKTSEAVNKSISETHGEVMDEVSKLAPEDFKKDHENVVTSQDMVNPDYAHHSPTDPAYEVSSTDGNINTLEIVKQTMTSAISCMDWEVRGVCVWVSCIPIPPLCTFSMSIKTKNFVPELVVQSYDRANDEPWSESKYINNALLADADSSWIAKLIEIGTGANLSGLEIRGGVSSSANKRDTRSLYYKFLDAYGNPSLIFFNKIVAKGLGLICGGQGQPFFPYFISNLDAVSWRWDIPEMFYPQSLMPLVTSYDLGTTNNNYGPIYPRHGFMTSQDPIKASVLSAFRAVHFITRQNEPHIYKELPSSGGDGYWPAGPLTKEDGGTGAWQMLYPKATSSCVMFPYDENPPPDMRSENGGYLWNFWRSYKCCLKTGDKLIYSSG